MRGEKEEWRKRGEKERERESRAPSPERGTLCLTNPAREASCSRPAVPPPSICGAARWSPRPRSPRGLQIRVLLAAPFSGWSPPPRSWELSRPSPRRWLTPASAALAASVHTACLRARRSSACSARSARSGSQERGCRWHGRAGRVPPPPPLASRGLRAASAPAAAAAATACDSPPLPSLSSLLFIYLFCWPQSSSPGVRARAARCAVAGAHPCVCV